MRSDFNRFLPLTQSILQARISANVANSLEFVWVCIGSGCFGSSIGCRAGNEVLRYSVEYTNCPLIGSYMPAMVGGVVCRLNTVQFGIERSFCRLYTRGHGEVGIVGVGPPH